MSSESETIKRRQIYGSLTKNPDASQSAAFPKSALPRLSVNLRSAIVVNQILV